MLDSDSTGYIDMDNIKKIFGVTRKTISDDVWRKVIEEVDLNGDGVISFDEFEKLMKKFTSQQASGAASRAFGGGSETDVTPKGIQTAATKNKSKSFKEKGEPSLFSM